MACSDDTETTPVTLFLSTPHSCAYLDERISQTLFFNPDTPRAAWIYQSALQAGFRRSGDQVYRPHCPNCSACVPVRIPVAQFQPSRSQARCWRRNLASVRISIRPSAFDQEHFLLYRKYTAQRHPDGGMAEVDEGRYLDFLITDWCETLFVEMRGDDGLMAVAVTDVLPHAWSAVYTFFDPAFAPMSPGVFAILWQIQEARRRGLKHLYLGFWIEDSDKMRYKDRYRPLEAWDGSRWRHFGTRAPLSLPWPRA